MNIQRINWVCLASTVWMLHVRRKTAVKSMSLKKGAVSVFVFFFFSSAEMFLLNDFLAARHSLELESKELSKHNIWPHSCLHLMIYIIWCTIIPKHNIITPLHPPPPPAPQTLSGLHRTGAQRERHKDLFCFTTEFHIITLVLVHLKNLISSRVLWQVFHFVHTEKNLQTIPWMFASARLPFLNLLSLKKKKEIGLVIVLTGSTSISCQPWFSLMYPQHSSQLS